MFVEKSVSTIRNTEGYYRFGIGWKRSYRRGSTTEPTCLFRSAYGPSSEVQSRLRSTYSEFHTLKHKFWNIDSAEQAKRHLVSKLWLAGNDSSTICCVIHWKHLEDKETIGKLIRNRFLFVYFRFHFRDHFTSAQKDRRGLRTKVRRVSLSGERAVRRVTECIRQSTPAVAVEDCL